MSKYLGLFILIFTYQAHATNTNAALILRAIVPTVMKVDIKMGHNGPIATLKTNSRALHQALPKFKIHKYSHHYLVSVTHP
jgi:hypothetical protein